MVTLSFPLFVFVVLFTRQSAYVSLDESPQPYSWASVNCLPRRLSIDLNTLYRKVDHIHSFHSFIPDIYIAYLRHYIVVRDLGVLLDSELTFSHHIDQVCRSRYYQLRQLRVIARCLTFNAAVSHVHAFVFIRLDYCSSFFVGLPGVRMEKLRRVH